MPPSTAFAPFKIRAYRFQWSADLLVSWAFEMETLILGWYVLVETGSVLYLTIYGALLYGGTLIAPIVGLTSDRMGHRKLLASMRVIYAAAAAALLTLAFTGVLNPLWVLAVATVSGLVRPSDLGLRGAAIADALPANLLTGAMSFSRSTSDIARITGALTGAGMFAAFGIAPAYVAITALYALGAVLTWNAVPDRRQGAPVHAVAPSPASVWSDLREGVAHIWNTPSLLAIVWLALLWNFTAFPLTNGLLPYVAKEVYRIDQAGLGYLVASIGFGAMLGAVAMSWLGPQVRLSRLMWISGVIWHGLILMFIQMEALPGGIGMLLLCGVAQSLTMVCHTVLLLRIAGPRLRGRVLGVRMLAIYSLPLGLVIAGVSIEHIGWRWTASLFAGSGLLLTVLSALKWRHALLQSETSENA